MKIWGKRSDFTSRHSQRAKEIFKDGYNCAQAVLGAFCDETGMDFETAIKIGSSFGGGMCRLREVCGAVTGMFMVAGLKYGYSSPKDEIGIEEHCGLIQSLAQRFKEENGSIICRELLAFPEEVSANALQAGTIKYYKRPCEQLVSFAAAMTDELIENQTFDTEK